MKTRWAQRRARRGAPSSRVQGRALTAAAAPAVVVAVAAAAVLFTLVPGTRHLVGPILSFAIIVHDLVLDSVALPEAVPVGEDADMAEHVVAAAVQRLDEAEATRIPFAGLALETLAGFAAAAAAAAAAAPTARARARARARAPTRVRTVSAPCAARHCTAARRQLCAQAAASWLAGWLPSAVPPAFSTTQAFNTSFTSHDCMTDCTVGGTTGIVSATFASEWQRKGGGHV
jgi:hypothetical protein